jgi:hypothetical protein
MDTKRDYIGCGTSGKWEEKRKGGGKIWLKYIVCSYEKVMKPI